MPALPHSYPKIEKPYQFQREKTHGLTHALRFCAAKKGFTLVEVLAATAIYALLLGSVFSLYFFSVNAYKMGSTRVDLQQNVRVAADFINRELRHALALQQVNGHEIRYSKPGDTAAYTIKYKNGEIVQLIRNTEEKVAYNVEALIFDWDEDNKILYFNIMGIDEGNTYAMRSAVCLQNLQERW